MKTENSKRKIRTPNGGSQQPLVRRLGVDELTRRAFVWAEQDRSSLADAWGVGTPERAEAESEYQQLKAYRMKRWGRTRMEQLLGSPSLKNKNVQDLKAS